MWHAIQQSSSVSIEEGLRSESPWRTWHVLQTVERRPTMRGRYQFLAKMITRRRILGRPSSRKDGWKERGPEGQASGRLRESAAARLTPAEIGLSSHPCHLRASVSWTDGQLSCHEHSWPAKERRHSCFTDSTEGADSSPLVSCCSSHIARSTRQGHHVRNVKHSRKPSLGA